MDPLASSKLVASNGRICVVFVLVNSLVPVCSLSSSKVNLDAVIAMIPLPI